MQITRTANGRLLVIDELLSKSSFLLTSRCAHEESFTKPDGEQLDAIWSANAPHNPTVSRSILWPERAEHRNLLSWLGTSFLLYPSRTPLDEPLRAIHTLAEEGNIVGRPGTDWIGIVASVFRYGPGQGLIWHSDSDNYSGAFTYFLHSSWEENWGGLFLFVDGERTVDTEGLFLLPRANRLLLLGAGLRHSISLVSSKAIPRLALSGFFVRPERADKLLARLLASKDIGQNTDGGEFPM